MRERNVPGSTSVVPRSAITGEVGLILWDMAQAEHLEESSALASRIQEELAVVTGSEGRGVKQAPFRVLVGASMPAVLVEVAFISNPEEEKLLATFEGARHQEQPLYSAVLYILTHLNFSEAEAQRRLSANNTMPAPKILVRRKKVHRAALAFRAACGFAVKFRHALIHTHA